MRLAIGIFGLFLIISTNCSKQTSNLRSAASSAGTEVAKASKSTAVAIKEGVTAVAAPISAAAGEVEKATTEVAAPITAAAVEVKKATSEITAPVKEGINEVATATSNVASAVVGTSSSTTSTAATGATGTSGTTSTTSTVGDAVSAPAPILYNQRVYLKPSDAKAAIKFGELVSLSGDYLAVASIPNNSGFVGVSNTDASVPTSTSTIASSGAVYLFKRNASTGTWSQDAFVKAINNEAGIKADSTADTGHGFGSALNLENATLVAGAPYEDSPPYSQKNTSVAKTTADAKSATYADSGAAYVYTRDTTSGDWAIQQILKAGNGKAGDQCGARIAVSGDFLAVGAPNEDGGSTGIIQSPITNHAIPDNTSMPASLTAVVTPIVDSGAVYIFNRATYYIPGQEPTSGSSTVFPKRTSWFQEAYIKPSDTASGTKFGMVALDGDYLVVGTDNGGSVYIFKRQCTSTSVCWQQKQKISYLDSTLAALSKKPGDGFGKVVALWGNYLAISAPKADSVASPNTSDAVYIYKRNLTTDVWEYKQILSTASRYNYFGASLSLSHSTLAIGESGNDSGAQGVSAATTGGATTISDSGAVYFYELGNDGFWAFKDFIKNAKNAHSTLSGDGDNDNFGISVSMDGTNNRLAVGAHLEDVNRTGIFTSNFLLPSVAGDIATDSGAAFIFTK